jgi:hypothetical protein
LAAAKRVSNLSASSASAKAASVVEKAVDLDMNTFTGRAPVTGAGGQERARMRRRLSFDAPLLDPCDQHPGVKEAGLCLWRGLRGGSSGRAQ